MLRPLFLLITALVGSVGVSGQTEPTTGTARSYLVERWTADEGLPNQSLSELMYGRDGYLWVGSLVGVSRFDGMRFTPVLQTLPSLNVRTLLQDEDGSVWAGMVGAGLARYDAGRLTMFSAQMLGSSDVRALWQDASGRVWAGLESGAVFIDKGTITRVGAEHGLAGRVSSVVRGPGDGVWLSTADRICAASGLRLRCSPGADARLRNLRGEVVESVVTEGSLAYAGGVLWVGGRQGVFSMRDDFSPTPPCADGCLRGRAVTSLLVTTSGRVAAGFADGGVALIGAGVVEMYGESDGLVAGPIVSLEEDREGSIWMAVYNGGLERLRPKRLRMFTTDDGLPTKVAGSIVQDRNGTIWAASPCGPVSEFRAGRFMPRFVAETTGQCPLALWAAKDGSLWIGTDRGLLRWDGQRMQRLDGLSDPHVRALFEDRDGVMWVGTLYGKLHTVRDGVLSRGYGIADGVAEGQIESFAQDRDGRVWIGSNGNGLSVFENGRFRMLGPGEAPAERGITGLFVDSRGDLWVATDRAGVYRRRNGGLENFGPAQGIGDPFVALMLEDRGGALWMSTARGITRLERERIEAVADGRARNLEAAFLDRVDGMVNPEVSGGGIDPTGLHDRQGRLWFSTIDGIGMIDPASFPLNSTPPQVVIESASISGQPVGVLGDVVQLEAGGPPLELSYTGLSLYAPRKMRFRFRMQGFAEEWIEAGNRRTAYYPHLPPGTYRFEVMAANNDGVWSSAAATIAVTVAPFWWERQPVRIAALLVLLVATGFAVRSVSVRRAHARLRELEREQALDRERRRIAQDLHDDIGARLTRMALMADRQASGGGELAIAARDAVQAMDELVWTVSAKHDTLDSLINYCVAYADEYTRPAGLKLRVQTPPGPLTGTVPAETRRHVFLCLKEALNNIVKHAGATEVRLTCAVDRSELQIEVRDNGLGFDVSHADPTGNGLSGMHERLRAAGGRCEVVSTPGAGTSVHVHVSLEATKS